MIDSQEIVRSINIQLFRLDDAARIRLWKKLAKLLGDGIAIIPAMEELQRTRKPSDPMYMALGEWISVLKNGRKVSDAVRDWVTSEEAMLLMAADQSGNLAGTLASVVKVTKAKQAIRGSIVGGLAYPVFLLIITFGVIYLLGYKIVPAFTAAAQGDRWTGLARLMVDSSNFIQNWFVWLVALVVVLIASVIISMPLWTGYLRSSFDKYPPYSIYRVMQGSSWLISMAALIEAGMRIESAMEELIKTASPWAKERIAATLVGIRSGKNLGAALMATGLGFPDEEIISDIRVYSSKSDFDRALKDIGDDWITESVEKIASLMNVVFGVALMLVASTIGFTMLGLFAIQTQLMQFAGR